eukprot:CAMPEP_0206618344 /NCGR_PEP_ID=MMETSP0325_2-20121206/60189_1 /ASSEMBLY_ACC=CAM_ASM_000347 /TAXON_ID=2866 /ORGANISM="Crypthecodinium cohnii, Strain Seligo" /LENGTH=85 /DNA_ID=CAMNT_0054140529 /DNA_START=21 /DNA_END=275 /DNA_ORIENTATION=+
MPITPLRSPCHPPSKKTSARSSDQADSSDRPINSRGHRKDNKAHANPFVEYEDREQKLLMERRWLLEDANYLNWRVQGLKRNTVQ